MLSNRGSPVNGGIDGVIDGTELARLMFEFDVAVTPIGLPYVLKRVDLGFFDDA